MEDGDRQIPVSFFIWNGFRGSGGDARTRRPRKNISSARDPAILRAVPLLSLILVAFMRMFRYN